MDEVTCNLSDGRSYGSAFQAEGNASAKALGAGMDVASSRKSNKGDCRGTAEGGEVKGGGRDWTSTVCWQPPFNLKDGLPV